MRHVPVAGRTKQIALRPVTGRMPYAILEAGVKGNRVERHLDVNWCRELRTHPAHTLAGGYLALCRFPLDDENAFPASSGQNVRKAGPDDACVCNDDMRCLR